MCGRRAKADSAKTAKRVPYGVFRTAALALVFVSLAALLTLALPGRGGVLGARAAGRQRPAPATADSRIPVLMYHSVSVKKGDPYCVPPADFERQMRWLHDNGYAALTLDALWADLQNREAFPQKAVAVTFDDGYEDNYTNALPVLRRYGFRATVFVITGDIGDTRMGYLSAAQLLAMDREGFDVESHTVTHRRLSELPAAVQLRELSDSRGTLESLLRRPVEYLSYPYGDRDAQTEKLAKSLGYRLCFDADGGAAHFDDSRADFPRAYVGSGLSDFIETVEG